MAKDYLAMIADIEESSSAENGRNEKRGKRVGGSRPSTPASILAASRYGSLTRGGLRDALILEARRRGWGCTAEDALLSIDAALEAGLIVGPDPDGLYWVRQ